MSNATASEAETIDLDEVRLDPAWALSIPVSLALRRRVLPIALVDGKVFVACENPDDHESLEAVARFTDQAVVPVRAEPGALDRALRRLFGDGGGQGPASPSAGADPADDATALADELLRAAIARGASDVHIDPSKSDVCVRLRVDGALEDYRRLPLSVHAPLCSRIKVLAGMDIAERRAPQDGGFSHTFSTGEKAHSIDIRVATLPTKLGERATLRLLSSRLQWLTLENLGMADSDLAVFGEVLAQPHGLVLLTGPTGSGKTTTLYAAIRRLLDGPPANIITVEDPVEYEIPGVAQVEVDSADKIPFGKALRSLLRHDPDVLVIGEIRDLDSLDIAVKASLTGHLVFSTLHTNDAIGVATRLTDMGMAPHLVGATLRLAVAQRLVRRLCQRCRRQSVLDEARARVLGVPEAAGSTVYEPGGCLYCAGRGFSGRTGLFECIAPGAELVTAISHGASEAELRGELLRGGHRSLLADGASKVLAGLTTVGEVLAVVAGD